MQLDDATLMTHVYFTHSYLFFSECPTHWSHCPADSWSWTQYAPNWILFLKNLFFSLFLATLGLHCCSQSFSSCSKQGLPSSCRARASHWGGFSFCRIQGSRVCRPSVVSLHGFSCPSACGIFLDQGSIPCALHWRILNCWTTREVPWTEFFIFLQTWSLALDPHQSMPLQALQLRRSET